MVLVACSHGIYNPADMLTGIACEKDRGSVNELICNRISTVLNAEIDGWQCNRGNFKCQLHWQSKK